jgi:hypothetical protein
MQELVWSVGVALKCVVSAGKGCAILTALRRPATGDTCCLAV